MFINVQVESDACDTVIGILNDEFRAVRSLFKIFVKPIGFFKARLKRKQVHSKSAKMIF